MQVVAKPIIDAVDEAALSPSDHQGPTVKPQEGLGCLIALHDYVPFAAPLASARWLRIAFISPDVLTPVTPTALMTSHWPLSYTATASPISLSN